MPIDRTGWFPGRRPSTVEEARNAAASRHPGRVPYLTAGLRSDDEYVRRASARCLAQCGEPGLLALLRTAAHGGRRERLAAVVHLGECQDPRALTPLLDALHHDQTDRILRRCARVSLALVISAVASFFTPRNRYGGDYSNEWLADIWRDALEPELELRVAAARSLGRAGNVRALPPLMRMMRHQEPEVRQAARWAVEQLLEAACRLKPEQVHALGSNFAPELAALLREADEPLARKILALLCIMDDVRTLPAVEQVSADLAHPLLAQMAQQLRDQLLERIRREEARLTLLRGAASAPAAQRAQLLRPTLPHPDQDRNLQSQLLLPLSKEADPPCDGDPSAGDAGN